MGNLLPSGFRCFLWKGQKYEFWLADYMVLYNKVGKDPRGKIKPYASLPGNILR